MIKITRDVFDIAERIKEIDVGYELYRNTLKRRFEVYKNGELQSVLPFDRLDARTVEYLRKTRVENYNRLLDEIDIENARTEKSIEKAAAEEREYKTKNMVEYLDKNKSYIPDYREI